MPVDTYTDAIEMIVRVHLTEFEKRMLEDINLANGPDAENTIGSSRTVADLMQSLLRRNAIPSVRVAWFEEPEHNIGSMMSRRAVLEADGYPGNLVFRHPKFKPMLGYLLDGPALPESVILKFTELVSRLEIGAATFKDILRVAVYGVNQSGRDPCAAAEEFYKLSLEAGLSNRSRDVRSHIYKTFRPPH